MKMMPFWLARLAVRPKLARTLNFGVLRPTMQSVSQVSLPMRIALVATLAFCAIWFVALRPKPPAVEPTPTPTPTATPASPSAAKSAPGRAAGAANEAVGRSQQSAAAHEGAAGAVGAPSAAKPATPAASPATAGKTAGAEAAKPAAPVDLKAAGPDVSNAARGIIGDLAHGKVVVLLFWDSRLSDDREVHSAVAGLRRRGGKVAVHIAPIAHLARYEPITRGVPVVTSPTVLIIDRAGHGRAVGGLTVPSELEELVGKALKVKP
jgi:hypothetical protein